MPEKAVVNNEGKPQLYHHHVHDRLHHELATLQNKHGGTKWKWYEGWWGPIHVVALIALVNTSFVLGMVVGWGIW